MVDQSTYFIILSMMSLDFEKIEKIFLSKILVLEWK